MCDLAYVNLLREPFCKITTQTCGQATPTKLAAEDMGGLPTRSHKKSLNSQEFFRVEFLGSERSATRPGQAPTIAVAGALNGPHLQSCFAV
jgi:hypothetical protein